MSQRVKNIVVIVGLVLLGVLIYYFSYIVSYILIAAVLALIGRPLARKFHQIRYRRFHTGKTAAALLTLLTIWLILISFFSFLIPLVLSEVNQLSTINIQEVIVYLGSALDQLGNMLPDFAPAIPKGASLQPYIESQFSGLMNVNQVSRLFGSVASVLGNFFLMIFSVSFILFFFLKEEDLFRNWILVLSPARSEKRVENVMDKVAVLLKRYLLGILLQTIGVMFLSVIGYSIIGFGFGPAVVVGVFAGLINIIPYIGPWIGALFGLAVAVANHLDASFTEVTLPLMGGVIIVVMLIQFIDNMVFQTVIYSHSIKAHPLEIFFVTLMAGSIGGITGMILGIPVYTVIRVIAAEFLSEFKLVRQLSPSEETVVINDEYISPPV